MAWLGAALAAIGLTACASGPAAEARPPLELEVSAHPASPLSGESVRWVLTLTNRGDKPVTLVFPSTKRGDVGLSHGGVDVYHWAERRAFSGVRDEVVVLDGQTVSFELHDAHLAVPPGDYELLASLSSVGVNRYDRESVTVRPGKG